MQILREELTGFSPISFSLKNSTEAFLWEIRNTISGLLRLISAETIQLVPSNFHNLGSWSFAELEEVGCS
jgi:hypothetical protein